MQKNSTKVIKSSSTHPLPLLFLSLILSGCDVKEAQKHTFTLSHSVTLARRSIIKHKEEEVKWNYFYIIAHYCSYCLTCGARSEASFAGCCLLCECVSSFQLKVDKVHAVKKKTLSISLSLSLLLYSLKIVVP
jgi:hypothetical protein